MLAEIRSNPQISRANLAKKLHVSTDTVKEYIERLKKGALAREGATSAGYWGVLR
jgi:predicted HTH transcriptional regulator